ncbi:MAG: response regulator [Comamonas sp.]|nr:response regulator [Comamonas sp.]
MPTLPPQQPLPPRPPSAAHTAYATHATHAADLRLNPRWLLHPALGWLLLACAAALWVLGLVWHQPLLLAGGFFYLLVYGCLLLLRRHWQWSQHQNQWLTQRQAMRVEKLHLQSLIESTRAATWEWEVADKTVRLNEYWQYHLGYDWEGGTIMPISDWKALVHPDDWQASRQQLRHHFSGQKPFCEVMLRIRHRKGHWVWGLNRGKVISWLAPGKPERMFGTFMDISPLVQTQQRLADSEMILRDAIETTDQALVIFDDQDRLLLCNQPFRQAYALSAPVLEEGQTFEAILRFGLAHGQYPQAQGQEQQWLAQCLGRRNSQVIEPVMRQLPSGCWMKILERRTASGYTVGFHTDVTEFYQATQAAEAANRAKSRFLATMSHEIRTPLNGILGMAQMLQNQALPPPEQAECVRVILDSGQTLLALLNDILDLSKVEANRMVLEAVPFEPARVLGDIYTLFSRNAARKGLQCQVQWHGNHPQQQYLGDPTRLRQMLANLVDNAIKFSTQGCISIEATALPPDPALPPDKHLLRWSVRDQGIGIAPDKQARLFQPFTQSDDSTTRQFGGTGLGLSIVRRLAALMGGEAGVSSQPGKGALFWFTTQVEQLPPSTQADSSASTSTSAGYPSPSPAPSPASAPALQGHILVVEDNPTNQKVMAQMLHLLQLESTLAHNGAQAVQHIEQAPPGSFAAVLMDIQMPVMDGYTATARIRQWEASQQAKAGSSPHDPQHPQHPQPQQRLPIIAVTADAYAEDRQRCLDSGMDDFVAKPIDWAQLSSVLARWLPPANAASNPIATPAAIPAATPQVPAPEPAQAQTQVQELPLFDPASLLTQLGGNHSLAVVLVQSALQDLPPYLERLLQALHTQDWAQAQRSSHTLKGLCAQIGGQRLAQRYRSMNERLKAGQTLDDAQSPPSQQALQQEQAALMHALSDWLKHQPSSEPEHHPC